MVLVMLRCGVVGKWTGGAVGGWKQKVDRGLQGFWGRPLRSSQSVFRLPWTVWLESLRCTLGPHPHGWLRPSFAQRFGYLARLHSCLQSGRARYPLFPNPWRFHPNAEGRVQGYRSAAWCWQRCRLAYLGAGPAKCCLRAVKRDAPGARGIDTARLPINRWSIKLTIGH